MVDPKTAERIEQSQGIRLLTIREVAEALQCSERAVWGWTKAGKLSVVCLGRSRRYRPGDVQHFIAEHTDTGTTLKNA